MSTRTVIEISHDYLRRFKPEQFQELLYALGTSSVTEMLNRSGGKPIDWTSGIRILGQRHHSEPEWVQDTLSQGDRKMSENDEAEFELHCDGEYAASACGPRRQAWREILRYAAQYAQDGPMKIFEVTRREVPLSLPSPSKEPTK